ncbi:histidine kinase [Gemmiger formicilis]|nr:histidine kinase [Gemmiger formicilis]
MNPHFLYNTLDSIAWMCERGKTPMPSRWSMHWRGCSASASAAGMS